MQREVSFERNKAAMNLKCPICDFKSESVDDLNYHVKECHCNDKTCQTEDCVAPPEQLLWKHPCFYCGYSIANEEKLKKHRSECVTSGIVTVN